MRRKGRTAWADESRRAADTITVQSTVRSSFGTRFARVALAGLVTAGLGLSTTPVTASADAPFGFIGVSAEEVFWDTDAYQEQMLSQMQANGITELRQIWRWSNIEQVRGAARLSRSTTASTLAAARHNIRVLPIVGGEVPWATSRPPGDERRCLFPPRNNADFANHLRQVVERYGPNGALWQRAPRASLVRAHSLADLERAEYGHVLGLQAERQGYTELARVAANAIHSIDPDASIITAGAPNKHGGDYLRTMMKNGRARSSTRSRCTPTRRTPTRSSPRSRRRASC